MKRKGFFITGTDTDVGKTYISTQIIRQLKSIAAPIKVRKPIESGCSKNNNGELHPADGFLLWQANGETEGLHTITPYRFEPAIAPNRAAYLKNKIINTSDLKKACLNDVNENDFLIVEGAGGFYSPLSSNGLNADLASALQLDIVLIVKDQLGCINHTLLTLNAIKHAQLTCSMIILNQSTEKNVSMFNHAYEIKQLCNIPVYSCFLDSTLDDISGALNVNAENQAIN